MQPRQIKNALRATVAITAIIGFVGLLVYILFIAEV